MKCEHCGNDEATIQWTTVVNNEMKVSHLCEACAVDKGVDVGTASASAPLTDFLAQIGKSMGEEAVAAGRCPSCGMTASQLKQAGRLGCATCYTHFDQHLRGLLRRLHGGTQHVGKKAAAPDAEAVDRATRMQSLRRSLQRAVESEDFEHAAALRDQIKRLEGGE
jgi:protein arginine kinase activator